MTIGLCSNSRQISSVIDSCASSEIGESKNGGFQTPNRNKTSLFKRPGRLPVSGTSQIIIVIPPTQPYLQRKIGHSSSSNCFFQLTIFIWKVKRQSIRLLRLMFVAICCNFFSLVLAFTEINDIYLNDNPLEYLLRNLWINFLTKKMNMNF